MLAGIDEVLQLGFEHREFSLPGMHLLELPDQKCGDVFAGRFEIPVAEPSPGVGTIRCCRLPLAGLRNDPGQCV